MVGSRFTADGPISLWSVVETTRTTRPPEAGRYSGLTRSAIRNIVTGAFRLTKVFAPLLNAMRSGTHRVVPIRRRRIRCFEPARFTPAGGSAVRSRWVPRRRPALRRGTATLYGADARRVLTPSRHLRHRPRDAVRRTTSRPRRGDGAPAADR